MILSVNKVDKCENEAEWGMTMADIEKFCREHGNIQYFCTSGKSGINVTEMFTALGRQLLLDCKDSLQQLNEDDGSIGGSPSPQSSLNA